MFGDFIDNGGVDAVVGLWEAARLTGNPVLIADYLAARRLSSLSWTSIPAWTRLGGKPALAEQTTHPYRDIAHPDLRFSW